MKKLLGVLLVLLVVFVAGAYLIDSQITVTRSVVINAPASEIQPWVEDLRRFDEWATFDDDDESLAYTWGDVTSGVGATRSWTSEKTGNGAQTITRSVAGEGVWMTLEMQDFEPAEVVISFKPVEGGTQVEWVDAFDMGSNPVYRWMGLMMDDMVGSAFEDGLNNLKAKVEQGTPG